MSRYRLTAALAAMLLLAACGPDARSPFEPADASFTGGHSTGGNRTVPDDDESAGGESTESEADRTGGHSIGGN